MPGMITNGIQYPHEPIQGSFHAMGEVRSKGLLNRPHYSLFNNLGFYQDLWRLRENLITTHVCILSPKRRASWKAVETSQHSIGHPAREATDNAILNDG